MNRQHHSFVTSEATIVPIDSRSRARPADASEVLLIRPDVPPRVLIVDDDPTFLHLMERLVSREGLQATFVQSPEELMALPDWNFDVAIVDFMLGSTTGIELVRMMQERDHSPPVVLVSHARQIEARRWPDVVHDFVNKALGPYAILDAAYEAFQIDRIYRGIRIPDKLPTRSRRRRA